MFEKVIDMIIITYYGKLQENKEKFENEDNSEFNGTSKERKEMNELVQAIVILYQNKNTRL